MKKTLLLFLLFIFSCKTINNKKSIDVPPATQTPLAPPPPQTLNDVEYNAVKSPKTKSKKSLKRGDDIRSAENAMVVVPIDETATNRSEVITTNENILVPSNNNRNIVNQNIKTNVKEPGRLVYKIPDTMKMGKMEVIRVRINRDVNDKSIDNGLNGAIDTIIRTTKTMDVTLIDPSGNSFIIKKNNTDVLLIEDDEYTEWVFDVTPIKSGKNKLNLVISIIIDGNKKEQVYSDIVIVKTDVGIIVKTWWEKYWQWVFSTLLIPFFIWIYNKRKKKTKSV